MTKDEKGNWLDDGIQKAEDTLKTNYHVNHGIIVNRTTLHEPTEDEYNAIIFLIHEWDYSYESAKKKT